MEDGDTDDPVANHGLRSETKEEEDQAVEKLSSYLRKLGLENLASEISDARFARRIVEAESNLNSLAIEEIRQKGAQEELEQRLMALHSQLFDKAMTHNNIVLSLGYAGFFAIWSYVKDLMNPWDTKVIASLLAFSLLVFIYTVVRTGWLNSNALGRVARVYNQEFDSTQTKLEAILEQEGKNDKAAMRMIAKWPFLYYSASIPGFLAGSLLLALLFFDAIGFEFSFFDLRNWLAGLFISR